MVAAVVSAHALSLTVCKFLTGVIHDHAGLRKTVLLCDCAAITVLILLAEVTATPTGRVLAMAYGILSALALPLETIMLPLIAQDLFQGPQYNKMLGHHRIRQYGRLRRRHADRQSDLRLSRHLSADAAGLRMRHGRRHDLHPAAA